ncbi:diguanylate cyclase (GGDEF) domain-containing protein [Paractinoplanes atraurantiacus]|uniref:Diguanylate cyclase (GGDEF) domain-containing protein n=1 Tax=Paractinoplanes atraurantiacus TaxID=1036182 RepID=A0A285KSG8_9ACTN|nr:diguanylate cyclase (GGDEF) domain-containing protein [Actinoplanes atraurantiacus]
MLTSIEDLSSQLSDALAQLEGLRTLHEVSKAVHASLDLTRTMDAVVHGVTKASGFEVAVVNLLQLDGDFAVVSVEGTEEIRRELLGTTSTLEQWQELFGKGEQWGSLFFIDHKHEMPGTMTVWTPDIPVPDEPEGWHPEDCLFAPLYAPDGELVGVLSVDLPTGGRRPGLVQREMLELFAQHAAIAVQHARLHHELEEKRAQLHHAATHDPLTGLANRTLLRMFTEEVRGAEMGVLVIDLDDFKMINDLGGHDSGDLVLRVLAERMRKIVRPGDLLARTGGDEFVVVVTGEDVASALNNLADRMHVALAAPVETRIGPRQVGASIGHAYGSGDFAQLSAAADADMYRTKQRHRRVTSANYR